MTTPMLKEAAQLGSTLTAFASRQLEAALIELRQPTPGTPSPNPDAAALGSLASNVVQLVNQVGGLLTQLAQTSLAPPSPNLLLLCSANALTGLTLNAEREATYDLLVENNGPALVACMLQATIHPDQRVFSDELELDSGERRRRSIALPRLQSGKHTLLITATVNGKVSARKTVAINVLPPAQPHSP